MVAVSADTCNGTGYVEIGGVEFPCNGCRDCDFEWEASDEEEKQKVPF